MADQSLRRSWLFHAFSSLLTSLGSEFLPRRPEQDFVDINIVRLAYGEGDRAREGIGRNSEFIIKLAETLGEVRLVTSGCDWVVQSRLRPAILLSCGYCRAFTRTSTWS